MRKARFRDNLFFGLPPVPDDLAELNDLAEACKRCPLFQERDRLVFGAGDPRARIMLIGEAPGANENKSGAPFIGAAGQLLRDELLDFAQLTADDVYITNAVCCWPHTNDGRNREPNLEELHACWPRLRAQIYLVDPDVVVTLGAPAAKILLRRATYPLLRDHGALVVIDFPGRKGSYKLPVVTLLHPSWLDRNRSYKHHGPHHQTCESLKTVRIVIQEIARRRREHAEDKA